jgi:GT2 family glycosyltransferase
MADPTPTVAVLVATHERPELLRRCLGGLVTQTRPADEVVVVADGEASLNVLHAFKDELPITVVPHGPTGQAQARNDGLGVIRSDYVAITDDDCRPDPGWLAAILESAAPGRIVSGRAVPDPLDGPVLSVLDRTLRLEEQDLPRSSTANILYPRQLLQSVGGFDTTFVTYGEDTDLGLRARAAGADAVYAGDAIVYHAVHRAGLLRNIRERWRFGWMVRLIKLHPSLRRDLFEGWFWSRGHRDTLLVILGVVLTPLTPAGLVLAVPWLMTGHHRLHYLLNGNVGPPQRRLTQLGNLLLLDIAEVATCAWHSLAERSLLL